MPPIAAAIGAVAGGIGAAGGAILGAGGAALGGIASAGSAVIGAGTGLVSAGGSALGGLASMGSSVIGGVGNLISPAPGYGQTGGQIGPAEQTTGIGGYVKKVIPLVQAGRQVYGMFQTPEGQPTSTGPAGPAPAPAAAPQISFTMPTFPNIPQQQPGQQIITTPPILPPLDGPPNQLQKYAPLIGLAVIGYILLKKK